MISEISYLGGVCPVGPLGVKSGLPPYPKVDPRGWNLGDIEMAIALKRAELNQVMGYRKNYDAEEHNLCLALIRFQDGSSEILVAYSNDSAIPESIRLGLHLIPNVYDKLPPNERFGCDGMAQYHTEPKLLNYLLATLEVRQTAYRRQFLPRDPLYRFILQRQRQQARAQAVLSSNIKKVAAVVIVTEIDCCPTCTAYSIARFRERFPGIPLRTIELGKQAKGGVKPQYRQVTINRK
ncbi:MAG TPA: hypothetical protein P5149_06800 [Candidatus Competibacteraceae bacterium]|nr:hypothetical protein [Candidatus Competibacteraceae bacterium]MCP5132291.1 hypothetical protein [Gammaproteobacteria bacterium]HPF59539.1 hypothetical protein [Candidatus Competibacteraceae bacterium]HRY18099.1 hypothetical protein [Candidatus Competibacteraceae bacterium]